MLTKTDILKIIGTRQTREIRIDIDTNLLKQIEYIHYTIFRNETTPRVIRSLIVNFGLACLIELVDTQKVKSIFQVMKILKLIRNSIREFTEAASEEEPMIQLGNVQRIMAEFVQRKYTPDKMTDFFDYFKATWRNAFENKILLDREDLRKAFVIFELSLIKKVNPNEHR